jgi:hypothetical protein
MAATVRGMTCNRAARWEAGQPRAARSASRVAASVRPRPDRRRRSVCPATVRRGRRRGWCADKATDPALAGSRWRGRGAPPRCHVEGPRQGPGDAWPDVAPRDGRRP